jgi:hypothetical protein
MRARPKSYVQSSGLEPSLIEPMKLTHLAVTINAWIRIAISFRLVHRTKPAE